MSFIEGLPMFPSSRSLEVGEGATEMSSNVLLNTSKHLQSKLKHAGDFGMKGTYSKANAVKFSSAINQHINSKEVRIINGTYRGQSVIHYLNPNTGLMLFPVLRVNLLVVGSLTLNSYKMYLNMEDYSMKAKKENRNISLIFNGDEAIVLFEWLHNFNEEEHPTLFQDEAEKRILFDLEAELEKTVSNTFEINYKEILFKARKRIRDSE